MSCYEHMSDVGRDLAPKRLELEMQARPELRKSLEEFRKKPYALRRKDEQEQKFDEVLQEEFEKQKGEENETRLED